MKKEIVILVLLVYLSLAYTGSAFELDCMVCHQSEQGSFPAINPSLFGNHTNVNETDGPGNLTSWDCMACHYSASKFDLPHTSIVSTYTCEDCHINGTAPRVSNHNRTGNVSVTASCASRHNKTSNLFRYSANASAAHYGRNASFGLSPGASYCAYCHSNSSTMYGDVMENQNNNNLDNHTSGRFFRPSRREPGLHNLPLD